jgi:hypothetical protein
VVVEASLQAASAPLTGECGVVASGGSNPDVSDFFGAFYVPANTAQTASFSGMLAVPSDKTPATPAIRCADSSGSFVPGAAKWWISSVG